MLGLHLSKTIPYTSYVSSIVAPIFFTILISFKSTFVAVLGSIILITDLTANGERSSLYAETTLELNDVLTHYKRV